MHQRGGLQSLAGGFAGHFGCRQLAQFIIDQGQELVGRLRVAVLKTIQDDGYLVHGGADITGERENEA